MDEVSRLVGFCLRGGRKKKDEEDPEAFNKCEQSVETSVFMFVNKCERNVNKCG